MVLVSTYCAKAELPLGTWRLSGNVEDVRISSGVSAKTNSYSFEGHYSGRNVLINMTPHGAEDDIAESVGKDGDLIYLIQRYAKPGMKDAPRTESLAVVEPTVFSRYASHALASVLMAFATTNDLDCLASGTDIFILGNLRRYPEENNTFAIKRRPNGIDIEATCYGGEERGRDRMMPIQGFDSGFKRWAYKSKISMSDPTHGVISVQYERFYPHKGHLILDRRVIGEILLSPENEAISSFKPKIQEDRLVVHDYRFRALLFPISKGIADQYHLVRLTRSGFTRLLM
jgi:hypothetical protein